MSTWRGREMARILYLEEQAWQVDKTVIIYMERELGHVVTLVKSVDEIESELSTNSYDAVFLDIMLDRSKGIIEFENSGLLIAQRILNGKYETAGNPSTLPIVLASGVWDATIRDLAGRTWTVEDFVRHLGIPGLFYLRKPFLVDEVEEILKKVLRKA
jgi:DNA-binding response OmpR family regulator